MDNVAKDKVMTLQELLSERSARLGDKTFLYWEDATVSYSRLHETALAISGSLAERGIKKNDKIGILMHNCPEFIYSFFGIVYAGAVAVPVNFQFKAEEVQYVVENSDAKMLLTTAEFEKIALAVKSECPGLEEIVVSGGDVEGATSFKSLMDGPSAPPVAGVTEEDVAVIIYTSGTTGRPKGVLLTHGNYVANAEQITDATGITSADRLMCILPLFHVNGQMVTTISPLFAGGSMVLLRGFSPSEFFPKISHYKVTAFSAVPTVYAIMNNVPDSEEYDLSSLRFCICGAAPMPVQVFETFEKKYGLSILEGYGLSEGTCASSFSPPGPKRKIGSIGIPFKGQEMKIFDENDREVEAGKIGEIVIRGPNVMKGYYKDEEATRDTLRNGWLHTGDLGYMDEDGYFYIKGRKKDMIIRGGENIYPKEIEEVLYRHPSIAEAAVVGVPDKIWGEEVAAFVVPREGRELRPKEAMDFCRERLADYKCPKLVEIFRSLPKTATGEIQKTKILQEYSGRG